MPSTSRSTIVIRPTPVWPAAPVWVSPTIDPEVLKALREAWKKTYGGANIQG